MPIVGLLKKFIRGEEKKSIVKNIPSIVRLETDVSEYWTLKEVIGDGAFGNVYKAVSKSDPTRVAAAKAMELDDDEGAAVMVEVEILTNCVHPNIVQLYDAFIMGNRITLLLEFCGGGAIDSIMVELSRGLSEPQIHCVMKEVLKALQFLHQNNVIHRDLKAGNVLLTNDARVKLADFGVSAFCKDAREERSTFIGTPYWMAPEVMLCETFPEKKYNNSADIWSFGITLIEMAEERPPYSEMNPAKVVFKVIKAEPPSLQRPNQWSSSFRDVVSRCLVKDPQNRPTAFDLIAHSFFAKESDFGCVKRLICEMNAEQVTTEVMQSDIDDDDDTSSSIDIRFPSVDIMDLLNGTEKTTTTDDLMLESGLARKNDAFENGNDIGVDLDRTPRAVAPSQRKVRHKETRRQSDEQEIDTINNLAPTQSPTEQVSSKKAFLPPSSPSKVFDSTSDSQFTERMQQRTSQRLLSDGYKKTSSTPLAHTTPTPDSALMRALTDLDDALDFEDSTNDAELHNDDDERILSGAKSPTSQGPSSHSLIIVHDDEDLLAAQRHGKEEGRGGGGKANETGGYIVEDEETKPKRPPRLAPSHRIKEILSETAGVISNKQKQQHSLRVASSADSVEHAFDDRIVVDDDHNKSEEEHDEYQKDGNEHSLSDSPHLQQQHLTKEQEPTQQIREILREASVKKSITTKTTANEHITHTFSEILKQQTTTNIPSNGKITLAVGGTIDTEARTVLSDKQRVRSNDRQQQRRQPFDMMRSPTAPSILQNDGKGRRSADTRKDFRGDDDDDVRRLMNEEEREQKKMRMLADNSDRNTRNEDKTKQNDDDDVQEQHQSAEIDRRLVRNAASAATDQELRIPSSASETATTEDDNDNDNKQSKTTSSIIENAKPKQHAEQRPSANGTTTPKSQITTHDTTPTTSTSMTRFNQINNNNNEYNYFGTALSSSQSSNLHSLPSTDANTFDEKSDNSSYFIAPPPPEPPVDYEDERRKSLIKSAAVMPKTTTDGTALATTNSNQTPKRNNAADNVGSRKSPHRQTVTRKTRIYMVDGVQVTSTTHQVFGVKQDYELRKQQLHDLRRLQREEARQLRELYTKAESQRNEQAKRFSLEKENIIKSSDLELQALARTQKHQMKEAEDSHTEDMKQTLKRIQYEQERNLRAFRESLKHEQKHLKMEVDAMPKAQRKDLFRVRKDQLDRDQMRRESEFLERQQAEQELTLRKVQLAHKLRILQLEKKFQQQKHAVLRSREASEWDMEEKQTLERHILYKQELKDRFYLQRTQMLARHQRELEHMRKVNEMNEDEAQRNYAVYKKRLPKDFRTESKTRIAMFKESLRISCQSDDASTINEKMRAFEEKEKMRVKNAMNDHELKAERKLRELRSKNQAAIKELEEIHNEKRKMLLEAEQSKLEIYEKEYEQVVADWKAKLPLRKQELEAQFAKELDELDAFYRRDNAELQAITSQPFANQSLF